MAGLSRVPFNLLQVLSSNDLNEIARLLGRDVLEALRYLSGDRPCVLGGLVVTGSPTGVVVAPGALIEQYAGGGISAPRSDESSTVLGYITQPTGLDVAAPSSDSWFTVEARPTEVDVTDLRPIYDEPTATEPPTTVVVSRNLSLEIRARQGTSSAIAAPITGWVPLAALFRRASGGTVPATDLIDIRPLSPAAAEEQQQALSDTAAERFDRWEYEITRVGNVGDPTFPKLSIDVSLIDRFGQRLLAQGTDLTVLDLLEPGLTPAEAEWLYIYIAAIGDTSIPPRTPTGLGVLVISRTPPVSQGSRVPSAPIGLPAPWGAITQQATCIGALRTLVAGNTYCAQSCINGVWKTYYGTPVLTAAGTAAPGSVVDPAGYPAANARRAAYEAIVTEGHATAAAGTGGYTVYIWDPTTINPGGSAATAPTIALGVMAPNIVAGRLNGLKLRDVTLTNLRVVAAPALASGDAVWLREMEF